MVCELYPNKMVYVPFLYLNYLVIIKHLEKCLVYGKLLKHKSKLPRSLFLSKVYMIMFGLI